MSRLHRILNIFRSNRISRDIDREMEFHIAERVDESVARLQVVTPAEALLSVDHRHLVGLGLGVPGHDVHSRVF